MPYCLYNFSDLTEICGDSCVYPCVCIHVCQRNPCVLKPNVSPHSHTALGSAETRWPPHPARGTCGWKPNAGAVRQAGGRKHQNEALDGSDICAFNRQREAVVQVEVTSYSSSPPLPLLPTGGTGEMVGSGADNRSRKGLRLLPACHHSLLPPYHSNWLHVCFLLLLIFKIYIFVFYLTCSYLRIHENVYCRAWYTTRFVSLFEFYSFIYFVFVIEQPA